MNQTGIMWQLAMAVVMLALSGMSEDSAKFKCKVQTELQIEPSQLWCPCKDAEVTVFRTRVCEMSKEEHARAEAVGQVVKAPCKDGSFPGTVKGKHSDSCKVEDCEGGDDGKNVVIEDGEVFYVDFDTTACDGGPDGDGPGGGGPDDGGGPGGGGPDGSPGKGGGGGSGGKGGGGDKGGGSCSVCKTSPGAGAAGLGSVIMPFGLGLSANGRPAGKIELRVEELTPLAAKPAALRLVGRAGDVFEVRDTNGLRQVLAPQCLVDIVANSPFKYTMSFYHERDVVSGPDLYTGCYNVSSQAQASVIFTVENPDSSNDCRTLRVVVAQSSGFVTTNEWHWTCEGPTNQWTMTAGNGLRVETLESYTNDSERIDVRTVADRDGHVASKKRERYRRDLPIETLVESVVDPDGVALTEKSFLYENVAETGRYGCVSMTVNSDGTWVRYDYNADGWRTKVIKPWLDAATNAAEESSHVTEFSYQPVDGKDSGELVGYKSNPRMETESIAGKMVAKTYYAYYENDGGERVQVKERCADPGAAYGAASNLRMESIFAPKDSNSPDSEKIKSRTYPDGRKVSYVYEWGVYATNAEPAQCVFSANETGDAVRVTATYGTTNSPGGVALKTFRNVTVRDRVGHVLMQESYVYTGSGYERTAWVVNTLDELGRALSIRKSDGSLVDMGWACCGMEWKIGTDGRALSFGYDAMKRVTSVEEAGIEAGSHPAQANVFTEYTYDAEGRQLTKTVRACGLSIVTSNQYDLVGRLVSSIDPAGIITQYGSEGLTNTTIRGGLTNVVVRYLDGNTCYTLENGVVKSTYAYGVNDDGTRWTKVYTGSQGISSPAWTKSTTDLLGRTISEEKPGFGGTILANAYVYNAKGQLIRTTNNQQPATLFEYDDLGHQIQSGSDVNGNGTLDLAGPDRVNASDTSYQSDSSGNWWQIRTSILYAGDNATTPTTNNIQKTRLTGLSSSSALGTLNSELISSDLLGNQTIAKSYVDRNAKTVTQVVNSPASAINTEQITVNGLMVASTSKTGAQTTYTYDDLGRQVCASSGGGSRSVATMTHYNALGQVDSIMDAASNTTTYVYDSLGRRIQVTDALSNSTYTAYDAEGRVTNTWGATYPVGYVYDSYGRMTEMKTLREENGAADTTRWLYDEATGLLTNKLYADGKGPTYTYTPDGKLATRTWARGVVTSYSYDTLGQLTNIHYSTTNTPDVSFAYDRMGRQTTITDGQGSRTFAYNDALQLASELSQISNQQFEITHQYDAYGRSSGFDAGDNYSIRYAYDQVGRFAAVSNNVGGALRAATYSYLVGSDLLAGLSNGPVQVIRSYEPNRNLITQVRNTSGSTFISQYDYANDAVGRRTSVGMTGEAFSDLGASYNKYAYNERSELEQAKRYAGTNLASTANAIDGQAFLYGYDLIGNRTETYIGDMLNGSKHTYTANSLNQYTQKTVPGKARIMGAAAADANVTVNNQATTRYGQYFQSYLDIANSSSAAFPLVSIVGVKNNSGTNGLDVVTTATGHVFVAQTPEQFSYDDDGNLTQDGRWTYTWDDENRLIGMQTLDSIPASVPRMNLAFAYDYMSRRVSKTVSTNSSFIIQTSSFVYDGWNLISERSTANSLLSTNSYVWGLDLSGTHQGAGGIGGLLFSTTQQSSNSTTAFFSYDANGNVGQLVSTNGSILARYEYDPYGKLIKEVADANVRNSPFRFSTKYIDSESGLYYYGYRYYQPEIGRWVSRDPITEKGSGVVEPKAKARLAMERYRLPYATRGSLEHAYLFVLNHPTVAVDVLGLQSLQDILHHCSAPKVWGDKPNGPAPSVNGCSLPPPLSWVIDPNNPSGHASFLNACNGHDTCYENCSTPKSVCDDVLHYGMQGACYQAGLAGDDLADCLWWADTYYWAVSSYGQGNYDAAQNAHCECRCP